MDVAQLRKDQGFHECEVFGHGPEAEESRLAWETCEKTQNSHVNFIPIQMFSEDHLPDRFRNTHLLEFITLIAKLTVRLRVNHISAARPDDYCFASYKGKNVSFTGSGWVYKILPGDGPCPCQDCAGQQPQRRHHWWRCDVLTACHVVYDKEEANKTKVDLFYDTDKSFEDNDVKTLYGYGVEDNNERDDVCLLKCTIHDEVLAFTLKGIIEQYDFQKWDIPESSMSTLCVVISHPHGEPKKVTVGDISSMAVFDPEASNLTQHMYTYTAETCRGSSGAPVVCAMSCKKLGSEGVWPGAGPHSFGHVNGTTLNQCSPGIFYVEADLLDWTLRVDGMKNLKTATKPADFTFFLMGDSGEGKKSVGNAILKRTEFPIEVIETRFATSEFMGKTLKVVNMIDLGSTGGRRSKDERVDQFLKQIQGAMSLAAGGNYVFLFVLHCDAFLTSEDVYVEDDTIHLLYEIFGTGFVNDKCILVMANGGQFENEKNLIGKELTFDDWCKRQGGCFRELWEECGRRALLFDNTSHEKEAQDRQIEKLLELVDEMQAKERIYMERDVVFNSRDPASTVMEKINQEGKLLLGELQRKKSDLQYLKMIFIRTKSLMRYVGGDDKDSDSLRNLKLSVFILLKSVEEAVRFLYIKMSKKYVPPVRRRARERPFGAKGIRNKKMR
ncbi:immune-associated nucleotide-binding protein 13 [Plakobranchus ocellatus]|uniref:Immune-associated nucleotide-binding protein 13 n=1 Tax=Plakobranchus ocellatus TaxID=259542 RepID=A0AAV3ZQ87_9GAST|nr:immune-associated nucleotide-binding protein 13 [Plakobranchus ocellatus]